MRIALFSLLISAGCLEGEFPDLPAPAHDAGDRPLAALSWPPDGAHGVPREPELLAVWFEGAPHPLALEVSGEAITFESTEDDCEPLGFPPGRCVRLALGAALPEHGELQLRAAEAPIASMRLGAPPEAPRFLPPDCALFEREIGGLCLDTDDQSVRVRARLDRSARARITLDDEPPVVFAPGGRLDVLLPLTPGCPHPLTIELITLDGRTLRETLLTFAEPDLAPVHIVETLPNPYGPEPSQEYVELFNSSDDVVDLGGFSLTDDERRAGDVLPEGARLPPRGRLLLVGSAYDPDHPRDPSPPPGAILVRLDASLAYGGLSNSGEALYLLDRAGRRVSSSPASPVPKEGACLLARSLEDRRPSPERFMVGTCSPGR